MTGSAGLLRPGAHRAAGVADDAALVAAVVRVQVAWLRALASVGAVGADDVAAVETAWHAWRVDVPAVQREVELSGSPALPLVRALRQVAGDRLGRLVHRGLTSQDVVDTALMLLARDALVRVRSDLTETAAALAELARAHRSTVMVGRTLTQHAVPITFGLKAARWLDGVLDGRDGVDGARAALPAQCGGAAGTLALVAELTADPVAAGRAFAAELGLRWPGRPWHTARAPVTRTGDALVAVCDALGVLAGDVALLSRPEIGEVREGAVPGRGGSSTMPQKRNPVLSVLVRSAALQAPLLGAQLHLAAAQALDERPDGAWHSEWPALRGLLELTVTAASQAAELAAGLEVDGPAMQARARGAAADLLAERGRPGSPADYLGAASEFVDAVLRRAAGDRDD
ncbi:MAG: lyase family protein [Actinomycetes bacterium]